MLETFRARVLVSMCSSITTSQKVQTGERNMHTARRCKHGIIF